MSLASYTGLLARVARTLVRSDLTADIPDFITLAEAQMNRILNCRQMVEMTTITLSGESYSLPCGFAGVKSFRLNTDPVQALEYRLPDEFDDARDFASIGTGVPRFYTIAGDKFFFAPTPDANYAARLRYRTQVPALGPANPSNWMLENHPDAYLYGACLQAAPLLQEDDRLRMWASLFERAIADINADDTRQNTAAHPAMRVKRMG